MSFDVVGSYKYSVFFSTCNGDNGETNCVTSPGQPNARDVPGRGVLIDAVRVVFDNYLKVA